MGTVRLPLYWENINAATKPMYEQLDAKLVEVGVYMWNNAPHYSSRTVRAYLGVYGDVPVVVTCTLGDPDHVFVKVWELPTLREFIYIGFEYGKAVAKFNLLRR